MIEMDIFIFFFYIMFIFILNLVSATKHFQSVLHEECYTYQFEITKRIFSIFIISMNNIQAFKSSILKSKAINRKILQII